MSPKAHPTWFAFVRWLVRVFFFRLGGGFRSIGAENIPASGPVIVAPNHMSNADPPAVACGARRRMRFMAKIEMFNSPFAWLFRSLGAFPVRRGEGDTEAIRLSMQMLEEGEALVVFPEGNRGDGITLSPLSRGVAMLAKKSGAAVVPAGIVGSQKKMPRGQAVPRFAKVTIVYGKPFTYAEVATASSEKENRELFAKELEKRILDLCAQQGLVLKTAEKN